MKLESTARPPVERSDQPVDTAEQLDANARPHDMGQHWRHWGLMVLCCLPMLAILLLIALGVWGAR